jgi:acyl-CoA dehydrogenase
MTAMADQDEHSVDPDLIELFDALLAGRSTDRRGVDGAFDAALWSDLESAGLAKLTGGGEHGSGATWLEAAELLRTAAFHGVSLPIAENDVLAGWLAERAELPDVEHLCTTARSGDEGIASGVPWGRHAQSIVLLLHDGGAWHVQRAGLEADRVSEGHNLAGEPRDLVTIPHPGAGAVEVEPSIAEEWHLRGALARAVQISGALQRSVDVAVRHSLERTQFGRPIGAFQAVQHLVADIAAEASLVLAATDRAVQAVLDAGDWQDPQVVFDIAVAKSAASAAASTVTRGAHQILGAIGTTIEHPLHTVTLPALAWATEFGSASHWNRRIVEMTASPTREATPWQLISRVR